MCELCEGLNETLTELRKLTAELPMDMEEAKHSHDPREVAETLGKIISRAGLIGSIFRNTQPSLFVMETAMVMNNAEAEILIQEDPMIAALFELFNPRPDNG